MGIGFLKGLSNLSLSFGGGSTHVGVSIGASAIKIAELKKSGKTYQLQHFGVAQLPEEAIVNREIVNAVAVIETLKALAKSVPLKNKNVVSSLSGTALVIKRMSLQVTNPKELQDQVFWEAEQYLPFDPSEVVMDFDVLSKGETTDIMLVAVKKNTLESYMGCLEGAALKPKVMDTDFFALQNVVESNYPVSGGEAILAVDIGASAVKIVAIQNGIPTFTKDTALGGRGLTQEIQRTLNLSFADAEALKVAGHEAGLPQEVSDLMHVMTENLALEIKRTVDFYNASANGASLSYILLSGGGAKLHGLSKAVEEQTGLPTQMLNPFNAIAYDPATFTPESIAAIGPVASVAMGLAIRGFQK